MIRRLAGFTVAAVLSAWAGQAAAGDNDLVVSRLGEQVSGGVVPSAQSFRTLASELGVVLAPRLISPADSLGFGGFQFSLDIASTTISSNQPHWRVLESSENPDNTNPGIEHGSGTMTTFGIFVRKGIWLPIPSFEFGAGLVRLANSDIYSAQGYAKLAIHEGFHDLPLPSVALRGAASRMIGTDQLDLTVGSLDLSVGKDFGVGGVVTVSPFGGWNMLFIVPRSEVLDATPEVNPRDDMADVPNNFAFASQDTILRQRLFAGVEVQYYILALSLEANFAFAGSSTNEAANTGLACPPDPATTAFCDAADQSESQQTYTFSLAVDF